MTISVLLNNLGHNQIAVDVISALNRITLEVNPIVYYENNVAPCSRTMFSTMNVSEAYLQPGICVSTDLVTTSKMLTFPRLSEKIFYSYDLHWLRGQQRIYEAVADIYCNKELQIIARSNAHAKAIANAFNVQVVNVCSTFNELITWIKTKK